MAKETCDRNLNGSENFKNGRAKGVDVNFDPDETVPLNLDNESNDKNSDSKKEPKEDEKKISYFQLFRYATLQDKIFIALGTIAACLCGGIQPYVMMMFGDVTGVIVTYASQLNDSLNGTELEIIQNELNAGIQRFAINMIVAGIITIVTSYVAGILFSYSALRQIFHLRKIFLEKTLNQDISWYDVHKTGDFASTFTDNLAKIEEGIGDKVPNFIYFEAIFVVGIIMAFVLGWKLALVCIISLPLSGIIMGLISWLSSKFSQQEMEAYSASGAIAEEVFSSVKTVIAFSGQKKELGRYGEHLIKAKDNNIKKGMFNGMSNGILWFFVYGCYALSFWYGVGLILAERRLPPEEQVYTPANMVAVFFCTMVASWNFGSAAPYFEIFGTARGAATKVFDVLDNEPKINLYKKVGKKPKVMTGEILFDDVHFHYPSRPEVKILQGFNLTIKAGETVALVGSSGCGKSTVIQLIQRFYDPIFGCVYIDDNAVTDLNLTWLRNKIGVVGQEPALFATTIAENIRYGNLEASQHEIEKAAKKANAHNFIKNLPHGYKTLIGERGAQLSGGQKQRIAIARALIREPKILLLDEATSALDTTSEAEVQAALDAIGGVCTTIIVAHRLSTIRNANRIVVVHEGKVIEQGPHSDLMEAKGAYYNLVTSQGFTESEDETASQNISERRESLLKVQSLSRMSDPQIDDSLVEETEDIEEVKKHSQHIIFKVMKKNQPEWLYIVIGCLTSVVNGAALPVYGLVFGDIIGVLGHHDDVYVRTESNRFSLYFFIIGVVSAIATFVQFYCFAVAGEKLTLRIREQMFGAMLNQEMSWFDRKENGVGALCAKLSGEAASVQGAAGIRIGTVLNSLATFIISCTLAIYFKWKLALVLLSFSPIILVSVFLEQKFTQGDAQNNQKYLENSAKIAVEAIGNIRTVASLGCEKVFYDNYVLSLLPYVTNLKRKIHFICGVLGIARSVMYFAYACGMGYGAKLMIEEDMDYGTLFVVSEIVIVGSWSIGNAFSFSPNFQKGLMAATRIFKILKKVPDITNIKNPTHLHEVKGNIHYSKVNFYYPNRPSVQILDNLDLAVFQGKTVALVGASGCGKSTIIQLLERFYDPISGKVSLDNTNIETIDIQNLRSHLGIVSQEPNLFDRTIAENIAYGANHRKVGLDEIVDAAKAANIHNFIISLPLGYETNLGNKGTQLSGGQKQRIAIARALIRNPKVLLLDEATSALDNESEKIVQESLDNAKKDRTCIMIAHRLTTVQDADLICVMSEGNVVELGKHAKLLEQKGLYYKFYKLQAGQK